MRALRVLSMSFLAVACGPKPRPMMDAGPDEDAGVDAGVDAGRVRGDEPPTGWSVALPLPADAGVTTRWGVSASMALDQFGHPMIAALVVDPNADGVNADNRLVFTRWNGVTKEWQVPVNVEIIGDIDVSHPNRQVALSRSAVTGQIGIAYLNESGVVRYGRSEDEGEHFSLETVSVPVTDGSRLSNPVLAYSGDALHVAYSARPMCDAGACGKIIHRKRMGTGAFTDLEVQGTLMAREWPFAMALDSAGAPGFAFFSDDLAGMVTLSYVAAGSTQTVAVSSVMVDMPAKFPSVSLTLQGDVPRVAFHLLSAVDPVAQLWYAKKEGGVWSVPVALPRNGPVGMLDGTQWYQGIVSEGGTKVAVVGNFQRAGTIGQQCGGPKLFRSMDGAMFPMPCHPPELGGPTVHALGQSGMWVSLASHRANKLTIALDYETNANPTIGGGVIIYREP